MTSGTESSSSPSPKGRIFSLIARCVLGGVFVYMGIHKVLHPVEFLKLVRQYEVFSHAGFLNWVAATLPWFEIFCGLLLLLGIAIRGTALLMVTMLVPFTVLIFLRALAMHQTGGMPFCAIKFDCGCGAGEVLICRKLAENVALLVISTTLIFQTKHRWALRPNLLQQAIN
ncbi:MAG: putative oxidoreductase [Verrucomicrobiota bacterium]|jgi:uncharacterized membrane protein YphA (DoxX/SURF4 family)